MKSPVFRSITRGWLLVVVLAGVTNAAIPGPAPRVFRDRIAPHWFADASGATNRFWYRLDLAGRNREFVLVDAIAGKRQPAFDHERMAAALTKSTGRTITATALPVNSLRFAPDAKSVTLQGDNGSWSVDLDKYTVTPGKPDGNESNTLPFGTRPHPSRASTTETSLQFVNRLPDEVDLFWIDTEGNRQPYGSLRPGQTRDQHTYAGHVWLVAAKSGDIIAVFDATEEAAVAEVGGASQARSRPRTSGTAMGTRARREPAFSPDLKWDVFVSGHNLFLREVAGGKETQLTFDADSGNSYARNAQAIRGLEMEFEIRDLVNSTAQVFWAPDSQHFVAMKFKPGTNRQVTVVESSPKDQLQPKLVSYPYLKPGDDVPYAKPHLFDVKAQKEIPVDDALFANPWSLGNVRWWPESDRFSFEFNQRGHQVLRILGVDAVTGKVSPVVDEQSNTFICYSSKYFAEYLVPAGEIIWMSERDGWNHLYLYDAKTGQVKNQITKGEWVVRSVDRVDADKRQIWFQASGLNTAEDPYYIHYCRINFDGTGFTVLTGGDGTHSVQYSPDKRFLIDTWSRVDLAPVNELRRTADGQLLCRLEEADLSELTAAGWRVPERFVAKGRDGETDIHGVIFWPKGFDPTKKYPVLEDVYAGPQDSFAPKAFRISSRVDALTERGFIVVQADGMGTSNRSKKFHDVCWKHLEDAGFPDRIGWIKAAAAKHSSMDLARMGIYGTSAGGQSALRGMLDYPDFYKACVADSGCHDNRMDKIWWNEQWLGWPVDESYVRSSNVADARKLKGKLLLMVGELDKNVDPASTMQVVNALIQANKDFDLLVMPNGGHGVISTPYGGRRLVDFFAKAFFAQP